MTQDRIKELEYGGTCFNNREFPIKLSRSRSKGRNANVCETNRKRGVYPEPGEPLYSDRQVSITIKLPAELWPWLKGFVGKNSFFYCVEETIVTALRCMAGLKSSIGMDMGTLVNLVTSQQEEGITTANVMFSRAANPENIKAANVLLCAASYAAHGVAEAADSGIQQDEDAELILKAWSAAAGRDIRADIEAARQEQERAQAEADAKLARDEDEHPDESAPKSPYDDDDLIPF